MRVNDKADFDKENVFGLGQANTGFAQYFVGNSYLNPLTTPGECPIFLANVTFEPGCRNNWHISPCKKRRRPDPDLHCRQRLVSGRRESSRKSGAGNGDQYSCRSKALAWG